MANAPPQQFCVRWNSYQSNLQNAFPKLLISEHFVDVTLACENEMLKCHKVVLSACSTYFEKLLLDNPCQHPIIFMKDMRFREMQYLVDFMYKGEVNVTQDELPSLLKSAEALQIRGLCGSDQLLNQQNLTHLKAQIKQSPNGTSEKPTSLSTQKQSEQSSVTNIKDEKTEEQMISENSMLNASPSECDSTDIQHRRDEQETLKEEGEEDVYYETEPDLMDTYLEEEVPLNSSDIDEKATEFAIANVSCQYDGSPESAVEMFAGSANRRIRRSDEELRRAAECITRGQTFQTVSDQFNIPISTIRFYMARKGILPRRKRGRACSGPTGPGMSLPPNPFGMPGNTSPIGPPYHIVHYKLPVLGVSKLK